MICPTCNQPAQRYQISRRMKEIAQRPRPLIHGTIRAQERARQAALAKWQPARLAQKTRAGTTGLVMTTIDLAFNAHGCRPRTPATVSNR
jgi:hypothetical protein